MSQAKQTNQAEKSRWGTTALVGLALVAILSLGFAGYMASNQYAFTITEQQFVTNTQSLYSVQTQTVTAVNTVLSVTTLTSVQPNGYGYANYQSCGYYYGCYPSPGYYNGYYPYSPPCQLTGSNGVVACSGYLYQAQNGCTLLVVQTTSNPYPSYATGNVIEYYTLHNLPASIPQLGSWVTVNGQLYQGYNTASNGASCPNNYIVVSSIS